MAIHTTSANGMGGSTLAGTVITNTGMQVQDHMHISQDLYNTAGIVGLNTSLQVVQNGTPNKSINVSPGVGYIPNINYAVNSITTNKFFRFINDTNVNVVISDNAAGNPRITSIFAKFLSGTTPDGTASNVVTFVAVDGTAAASPTAPAAPVDGNSYLRLADITVANGFTSVVTANITDRRTRAQVAVVSGPDGFVSNYQISRTVASNNLTVSLLTKAGNTPSSTDLMNVNMDGGSMEISSSLSLTINAGANTFAAGAAELAAKEIDYFLYIGKKAADNTVFIGVSRLPSGATYADFSGTATNERYMATSSTPASTDKVEVIGRFNATLSASASFNWSIPATASIVNHPIYETRLLDWTPAYSASGSMTYTAVTTAYAKYQIIGRNIYLQLYVSAGTTGGTASNTLLVTAPFSASSFYSAGGPSAMVPFLIDTGIDTGAAFPGSTISIAKRDNSNFGLGTNRQFRFTGISMSVA